jgi:Family of unknown function (DUF5906)
MTKLPPELHAPIVDITAEFEARAKARNNGQDDTSATPFGDRTREDQLSEGQEAHSGRAEGGVTIEDFWAYMPRGGYLFVPCGEMWPGDSVDLRVPPVPLFNRKGAPIVDEKGDQKKLRASAWIAQNRPVECMTWVPGEPEIIANRLISSGGWIERKGCNTFNLYRPPQIALGDATQAGPWLAHGEKIFAADFARIKLWLAHRVQRSAEKINHALVLIGAQGIGKDTLLEPVKRAIGPWNFEEVSPLQVLGRFNGFVKSVILRVSEARDLGEYDRFKLYDHLKTLTASPPDVLRVDEKHLREHNVLNCTGVIITSNYKTDGIFLPEDDRRHFVACNDDLTKEDFSLEYWKGLWGWYENGGYGHVAAYLAGLDLSGFDPKAPPPKTEAFWAIVDAGRAPEESELADVLDELGNPDAVTLTRVLDKAEALTPLAKKKDGQPLPGTFAHWLGDRKNRRAIPHRMERCGYVPVRNDMAKDGLWKINGARQVIYARVALSIKDRMQAAGKLTR